MLRALRPAVTAGLGAMALAVVLGNTSCSSTSGEEGSGVLELAAACRQYASTLRAVSTEIRAGRLDADEIDAVETVDQEAGGLCEDQSAISPERALATLRRLTPRLVALQTRSES